MELLGVGAGEALVVLVIALILVGPQRFPELARQGGRWYRVARRYTAEVMTDVRAAMEDLEQEVNAEGEELRSVREIGEEFSSDLKAQRTALDETDREARGERAPSRETPAGTLRAVERSEDGEAKPGAKAGTSRSTSARPSKRREATKAPRRDGGVDPFEALEAKRARERGRPENDPPTDEPAD